MGIQTLDEHGMPVNAGGDEKEEKQGHGDMGDMKSADHDSGVHDEKQMDHAASGPSDDRDKTDEEKLLDKKKKMAAGQGGDDESELQKQKKLAAMTPEQRKMAEYAEKNKDPLAKK